MAPTLHREDEVIWHFLKSDSINQIWIPVKVQAGVVSGVFYHHFLVSVLILNDNKDTWWKVLSKP